MRRSSIGPRVFILGITVESGRRSRGAMRSCVRPACVRLGALARGPEPNGDRCARVGRRSTGARRCLTVTAAWMGRSRTPFASTIRRHCSRSDPARASLSVRLSPAVTAKRGCRSARHTCTGHTQCRYRSIHILITECNGRMLWFAGGLASRTWAIENRHCRRAQSPPGLDHRDPHLPSWR